MASAPPLDRMVVTLLLWVERRLVLHNLAVQVTTTLTMLGGQAQTQRPIAIALCYPRVIAPHLNTVAMALWGEAVLSEVPMVITVLDPVLCLLHILRRVQRASLGLKALNNSRLVNLGLRLMGMDSVVQTPPQIVHIRLAALVPQHSEVPVTTVTLRLTVVVEDPVQQATATDLVPLRCLVLMVLTASARELVVPALPVLEAHRPVATALVLVQLLPIHFRIHRLLLDLAVIHTGLVISLKALPRVMNSVLHLIVAGLVPQAVRIGLLLQSPRSQEGLV